MTSIDILLISPSIPDCNLVLRSVLFANLRPSGDTKFSCSEVIINCSTFSITIYSTIYMMSAELALAIDTDNAGTPDYGSYTSIKASLNIQTFEENELFKSRFGPCRLSAVPSLDSIKLLEMRTLMKWNSSAIPPTTLQPALELRILSTERQATVSLLSHGLFEVETHRMVAS